MAVTSSTVAGINVFQFSGAVTDAEIKTAWAGTISNGVYVLNRAIYLDDTADISGVSGGMLVDFGTQVLPAIILHDSGDRTKQIFNNFTFLQRTGLTVTNRSLFIRGTDGTVLTAIGDNGLSQKGGGFVYGVFGVAPGGGDNRYLNELPFGSLEGVTIYSQEFTEQELQVIAFKSTQLKGLTFEKAYGFPQIGTATDNVNVTVYRSNQNTQATANNGLIPIRLFPYSNRYASACYVDSYVTRNSADITVNLIATFGSNASNLVNITILNNFERGSWFGTTKTQFTASNWFSGNTIHGGVLKKLQFVGGDGGVVKCYDSRSTTAPQKSSFKETGFIDFLETTTTPTTDAEGKISLVHIGAIATGGSSAGIPIVRYTGQKYTFQKFGFRVLVATPDMTSGDNDLSAFSPVILTEQAGISRPLAAINSATQINNFQELLEELHVLAIGLSGSQSYSGSFGGNLFNYDGAVLTTSFTTVNVDATAGSKIAYNSTTNTLTIKSSVLTSALDVQRWNNSVGAVNLLNGAIIEGVYQDSTGTSTVLTLIGFEEGSSVYVEDNEENQIFFNANASGEVVVYIPPTAVSPWYFAVEKYGNQRQSDFFNFSGGFRTIEVKAIQDVGITQNDLSIVEAYTQLDNLDKIYDYIAYKRLTPPIINFGQIAFRDGSILYLEDLSLLVNNDNSNVLDFDSVNKLITIKTLVLGVGNTYTLLKADPPATITANTTEQINVVIEDANGDSQVTILGGDNLGYELWKVTNSTPTDDYENGELLITLPNNNDPYRFIGISGFDIVGRDISSGVRRRTSMAKGVYSQAFYVGNEIQLATDAPQLIENNQKLDELLLKVDTNLDTKVSTRLASVNYVEPDNISISEIKTKVDTLENPDNVSISEIKTKVDTLENTDLTGVALESTLQEVNDKIDNIEPTDLNEVLEGIEKASILVPFKKQ
jgi:hypothetical protein